MKKQFHVIVSGMSLAIALGINNVAYADLHSAKNLDVGYFNLEQNSIVKITNPNQWQIFLNQYKKTSNTPYLILNTHFTLNNVLASLQSWQEKNQLSVILMAADNTTTLSSANVQALSHATNLLGLLNNVNLAAADNWSWLNNSNFKIEVKGADAKTYQTAMANFNFIDIFLQNQQQLTAATEGFKQAAESKHTQGYYGVIGSYGAEFTRQWIKQQIPVAGMNITIDKHFTANDVQQLGSAISLVNKHFIVRFSDKRYLNKFVQGMQGTKLNQAVPELDVIVPPRTHVDDVLSAYATSASNQPSYFFTNGTVDKAVNHAIPNLKLALVNPDSITMQKAIAALKTKNISGLAIHIYNDQAAANQAFNQLPLLMAYSVVRSSNNVIHLYAAPSLETVHQLMRDDEIGRMALRYQEEAGAPVTDTAIQDLKHLLATRRTHKIYKLKSGVKSQSAISTLLGNSFNAITLTSDGAGYTTAMQLSDHESEKMRQQSSKLASRVSS